MKRSRRLRTFSLFLKVVACMLTLALPLGTGPRVAQALPHGGIVAKGAAPAPPRPSTGKLLISQSPSSATFSWSSYKVKAGESVTYLIPGSKAVSLKYIGGTTPSSLSGPVTSNGILDFMNPKGLIFGSESLVSGFGGMASGSAKMGKNHTGPVSNAGKITVTKGGRGRLSGSSLTNSGTIKAPGGKVHLTAGFTMTPIATTGVSSVVVITPGKGLVDDSGIISAEPVSLKTGRSVSDSGTTIVFKASGDGMIGLFQKQLLKIGGGRPDGSGGTNGPGSAGGSGGVKGSGDSGGAGGVSGLLGSGGTGGTNGPGGAGRTNGPGSAGGSGGVKGSGNSGGAGGSGGVKGSGNSGGRGGTSGLLGPGGPGGKNGSGGPGGSGSVNGSGNSGGAGGASGFLGSGGAGGTNGSGSSGGTGGLNGSGSSGGSGGVNESGNSGGAGGTSGLLGSGGAGGTNGSGSSGGTGGLNGSGSSGGSSGFGVTENQSTMGSSFSGSIGTLGITIDKFNPVFQTVNNIQSLSGIPAPSAGDFSGGDLSQAPSASSLSITLDESKSSSVTVLQPALTGIEDGEILSAQQVK